MVVEEGAHAPRYALPGDAGADLSTTVAVDLGPGERLLVPTGVRVALPPGCVGLINPRSGMAARTGLSIVNGPGTIDSGYRGELKVLLINTDRHQPIHLDAGDRIAQLVIVPVLSARFLPAEQLESSARGDGGYGSTGLGSA
ncbi:dUTP diphosphatase [Acidipropionibacterium thoenii]|uniref:dUTP diphosphatase n=1 Tax=Acidipropionibacterium thoenii TaxID=1751 RepID=UPI000565CACA|nr:dUTP diphosphatase [Acidipropionibacterium thoenii]